jgi:hypothetical protein
MLIQSGIEGVVATHVRGNTVILRETGLFTILIFKFTQQGIGSHPITIIGSHFEATGRSVVVPIRVDGDERIGMVGRRNLRRQDVGLIAPRTQILGYAVRDIDIEVDFRHTTMCCAS